MTWLITRQSLPHYFGPHYCQAIHLFLAQAVYRENNGMQALVCICGMNGEEGEVSPVP